MKYNVTLSYHGSTTVEVEAGNERAALEAARSQVCAMSDTDFNNAIGLMEDEHDVEEVKPDVNAGWVKPRFTAKDILKGADYGEVPYLKDINDSMELDSAGEDVAWLKSTVITRSGRKLVVDACVRVVGDVRVLFKGQWYRNASSMPEELVHCYHDGTDPMMLDPDYYVDCNNWFEQFIRIADKNGTVIIDGSIVIDDPSGEESFAECIVEYLNDEQECLGMLFKDNDSVRWNDPDTSLADQLDPDELEEYRRREFVIVEKCGEYAHICDDVSEAQVPYSELLLEEA